MKRLLTLTLITVLAFSACTATSPETANTISTIPETTTTTITTTVAETTITEMTTITTTTAETTTTTTKQEPAVCGTYRTVNPIDDVDPASISPEEEMFYYSYINVDQMDDGHFQVQFLDPYGGSDESYAVFDTEALGASQIINFSFSDDPIANSSAGGAVTITVEGDSAWVAFGDGEAEEYEKVE
jgi:hypothetical protein